jgi:hypothetical protein
VKSVTQLLSKNLVRNFSSIKNFHVPPAPAALLDVLAASSVVVVVDAHESSTHFLTRLSYSILFSENKRAASEFAGEFGFGSQSRLCIDAKSAATS